MSERYDQDAPQSLRRAIAKNDWRVRASEGSTYADHYADDAGGRWHKQTPTTVTGSAPVAYPELPPNSPFASNPVPVEPPLGINVDAQEPVGEFFEVQASLADGAGMNNSIEPSPDSPLGGGRAPTGSKLPAGVSSRSRHPSKRGKR